MNDLIGLFASLPSAFTDDAHSLSEVRLARLIRRLNATTITGYLALGDVAEFATLSAAERKDFIEIILREAQGRPLAVNVSHISSMTALDLAQHASRHGARAIIAIPPFYYDLDDDEIFGFYEALMSFAGMTTVIAIDSRNRFSDDLRARLEQQRIQFADPLMSPQNGVFSPSTDEFRFQGMVATPTAVLKQSGDLLALHELMKAHGSAKIVKAGLQLLDVEIGPLRPPLRALSGEPLDALRAAMS
jgi:dihydrodipicolinate synthase/N-acetylneuraminate lyase